MRENSRQEGLASFVKGSEEAGKKKALFQLEFPGCETGLFE